MNTVSIMFYGVSISMDTRKSSLTILFMVAVINSVIMSGDIKNTALKRTRH